MEYRVDVQPNSWPFACLLRGDPEPRAGIGLLYSLAVHIDVGGEILRIKQGQIKVEHIRMPGRLQIAGYKRGGIRPRVR